MHIARILFLSTIISLYAPLFAKTSIKERYDEGEAKASESIVKKYFHNSELQRQWAWELLAKFPIAPYEKILDFGCLDGKITAEMARLVSIGSVIGIDPSQEFLQFAKRKFPKETFANLEFQLCATNTIHESMIEAGSFDRITAFFAFDPREKPLKALEDLRHLLKTEGRLFMVVPVSLESTFFKAVDQTMQRYFIANPMGKTEECQEGECLLPSIQSVPGCKLLLQEAGYKVQHLEMVKTPVVFYDMSEATNWLWATFKDQWNVPTNSAKHFFRDCIKTMCEQDPSVITPQGYIQILLPRIHVVACLKQTKSLQDLMFIE